MLIIRLQRELPEDNYPATKIRELLMTYVSEVLKVGLMTKTTPRWTTQDSIKVGNFRAEGYKVLIIEELQ